MTDHHLLVDLISIYAIGLVLMVGLARLRVPPIVALILAGLVAAPSTTGIIRTPEQV